MKKQFKQLSGSEREKIYLFLSQGMKQSDIAKKLKRNKSTITNELKRNNHEKLDEYLPDTAQRKAEKRKQNGRKQNFIDKNPELKEYIIAGFENGWSPEEISGRMRDEKKPFYANHETIYQYVYSLSGRKQNLKNYLRRAHRVRHKKGGRKTRKTKIPNRVDIVLRPKTVDRKKQFGHWEGDTMMFLGHKQSLATHTERKTRLIAAKRTKGRTAKDRSYAAKKTFDKLPPEARRTMTLDNGSENSEHETITEFTGMKIYFARPYASWQRGANENSNGLIRWYLPRDTNLDSLTEKQLVAIIDSINNRPRKCLGYKTPNEMFEMEMNKIKYKSQVNKSNHSVAFVN
jgi:IS30 family transposase